MIKNLWTKKSYTKYTPSKASVYYFCAPLNVVPAVNQRVDSRNEVIYSEDFKKNLVYFGSCLLSLEGRKAPTNIIGKKTSL